MRRAAPVALALALAGCGTPAPEASTTVARTEKTIVAPAPKPPAAPAAPALTRFVGKYPFDKVGESSFFADRQVRDAVAAATADPVLRDFVLSGAGPSVPIWKAGDKVAAYGCEQHNCGAHNWTLLVAPDGSAPELCIVDLAQGETPRWYADGRAAARSDACPEPPAT